MSPPQKKNKFLMCIALTFLCDMLLNIVLSYTAAGHRMWALQRLRKLLTTEYGQSININRLLGETESEARSVVRKLAKFIPKAMVIYNIIIFFGFKLCSELPILM